MKQLEYVINLTRFALRENSMLYLSVVVSLFSVVIELLAMSSLLPLFELISKGKPSTDGMVATGILRLGFDVDARSLLWAFVALFTVRILTQLAGQSLSMYLGKRVMAQLSSQAFEQIVKRLSIQEISEKSVGFYISLAGDESFRASILVISLSQFISTVALAVFYFLAIALYSWTIAGLVLVFLLCCLFALLWVVRASHRLGERQTAESRKAHSVFLDSLNNLKAIRSFSAEKYVVGIYRSIIFGYTKILYLIDEIALLTKLVPVLLLLAVFSGWLVWGSWQTGTVSVAFIVTMIVYLMRFFPTVGQGVNLLMRIVSDAKSGRDVTTIVSMQSADVALPHRPLHAIEAVDLGRVSFAFSGRSGKEILNGVNLKFVRGRSYAVVGKSGVGKSTLVDILLKFYAPTSGRLCLNNVPISEIADSDIRRRIILISQEAAIFDDTVMNNICMGMDASPADVKVACIKACIHQTIEEMPQGYATRLYYQGKNLSGGQRQRIAIARGLLRKPDVLILDESTSALDKTTQRQVVDNILQECASKIVIFVTHDPEIMKRVSEVVDLEKINSLAAPFGAPDEVTSQ